MTFSNLQLTIYNGSGVTMGSGASACANNSVCQLTPSTTPLTLTFSTAPFPVTLTANSPLAFKLDINLNTIIQQDLTVNLAATNGVTISQLPAPTTGDTIAALGNLAGTIQSLTTNRFTLQTGDGRAFNIAVNNSTTYSNFPSSATCSTSLEAFSCLASGQIVKVAVSLQTNGTLLASEVDYVQPAGQTVVEGNIIRLSGSDAGMLVDIVLQQGPPTSTPNALPFGQRVTVTVPFTGVTYAVDSGSFTIPGGLSFAAGLLVGQQVSVVVVPGSLTTTGGSGSSTPWAGPAATTFTTNSITLEPSQITGWVGEIIAGGLSFTLNTYPDYFLPTAQGFPIPWYPASVAITVQTTSTTTFTNFTPNSISGLAVNDVVSVKGWVTQYTGVTCLTVPFCFNVATMAAEAVVGTSQSTFLNGINNPHAAP